MSKAIKNARNTFMSQESRKESDALTAKELRKKFPKKASRKKENLAKALKRKQSRVASAKRNKSGPGQSKRTTPGAIDVQSAPAYPHKEGARRIKNSNKKIKEQRVVAAHHGGVKK